MVKVNSGSTRDAFTQKVAATGKGRIEKNEKMTNIMKKNMFEIKTR